MEYHKKNIEINDEVMIEIHHNPILSHKPFLLKIYGYHSCSEVRLNFQDLLSLSESLSDFAFDNSQDTEYTGNNTGLHRLWHHRRNEALDRIEVLENKISEYEKEWQNNETNQS
jgi:hypothetical protein